MKYSKIETINMKTHSEFNEKWVQERIAEDPSILGLGDLILKDKERMQPKAGRLDLLLQELDGNHRYEVEIQLGATDESHIIRTLEYWDIEKKRYPQYEHTAVIIAEDITSRFLNVVQLFNGSVPIVAIQMSCLKIEGNVGLSFIKVIDEINRGLVEEDEEVRESADRAYWEEKGASKTVALADQMLELIKKYDSGLELKYNKFYIGLAKNGSPNNFVTFRPAKTFIKMEPRLPQSNEFQEKIEAAGLDVMEYDKRWGRYRIRLTQDGLNKSKTIVNEIMETAFKYNEK